MLAKVICAWCNKTLGKKEVSGVGKVTHGICLGCLDVISKELFTKEEEEERELFVKDVTKKNEEMKRNVLG